MKYLNLANNIFALENGTFDQCQQSDITSIAWCQ